MRHDDFVGRVLTRLTRVFDKPNDMTDAEFIRRTARYLELANRLDLSTREFKFRRNNAASPNNKAPAVRALCVIGDPSRGSRPALHDEEIYRAGFNPPYAGFAPYAPVRLDDG
jgi:hypothetical protein